MVAVNRGSTAQIAVIKEATAGTTPATPVLQAIPVTSFTPKATNTVIRSSQIAAHPFADKLLYGRLVHDFGLEIELAGAQHDVLLETFMGGTITTKALKMLDALKSMTMEEKVATGIFNSWTYGVLSSMAITASAGDTTPVKISFNGMAKTGTLDAAATIATSVTAPANIDPFTFIGATLGVDATATPVGSGTINFDRQVDPLMLLGSALPREFVPGAVTCTGTITVPYDDTGAGSGATMSTAVVGFADKALVWNFGNTGNTVFRKWTLPKAKFTSLGRALSDRGMRMQEVNYEAIYDSSSATIGTLTTE